MLPNWAEEFACAITVCNLDGVVLYMNDKAKQTFANYGDMLGKSIFDCHNENSKRIILEMISKREKNVYTIEKNGVRKLIYQCPWVENGEVAGLVELSMEIPAEMPHRSRD